MDVPLSIIDIRKILPNAKMLIYSDFKKVKSIDQLFDRDRNYIFIMYRSGLLIGHWVVLLRRYNNIIEFFDSYGIMIDNELTWLPMDLRKKFSQTERLLTKLLIGSDYKIHYNDYRFQGKKSMTCGRWCILRVVFSDLNENEFYKLIEKAKKISSLTNDQLAIELTT